MQVHVYGRTILYNYIQDSVEILQDLYEEENAC